mgnify:CR=1 FL=1
MKRSAIETIMGAVVLLVAGLFLVFAYQSTDLRLGSSYQLTARFNAVDGLTLGSDVRVGGVKVGSVIDQGIDEEIYQAVITLAVRRDVLKIFHHRQRALDAIFPRSADRDLAPSPPAAVA